MNLTPAIAVLGFSMFIVTGCSNFTVPRQTTLPSTSQKETDNPPTRVLRPDLPRLSPAETATPAKLKDDDHRKVSGDYAYVDLEAVLLLIGRINGPREAVTRVQFFHGIAASVMVGEFSPTEYLCTVNADRVWSIVGTRHWSH